MVPLHHLPFPTIPAYKADGSFNDWNSQWYSGTLFDSPLANVLLRKNDRLEKSLSSMAYPEITPVKNILIRSTISYSDLSRDNDQYIPSTMPTRVNANSGGYAYKSAYYENNLLNENTITYKGRSTAITSSMRCTVSRCRSGNTIT